MTPQSACCEKQLRRKPRVKMERGPGQAPVLEPNTPITPGAHGLESLEINFSKNTPLGNLFCDFV